MKKDNTMVYPAGQQIFRVLLIVLCLTIPFVSCSSGSDDDDSNSIGEDDFDADDDADDDAGDDDDSADDDDTADDDVDDDLDDDVDDDNDFDIEGSWEEDTWPDAETGLTWQTMNAGPSSGWEDAQDLCDDLSLGGFDDWRLPSISELRTIIRGSEETETGGMCSVTDDCAGWADCFSWDACDGGFPLDGPTQGCYWAGELSGKCSWYWSSVELGGVGYSAWTVDFGTAGIRAEHWDDEYHFVRCVRG